MALFVGEFDLVIDAKHRLGIPAALREQADPEADGKNFYLVLGTKRHLWLYPDAYYQQLLSTLRRSPFPTRQGQRLNLLFPMARLIKPDSQGRVVLPEKSMARANVSDSVTLNGQDDHIEIWPAGEWAEHVNQALPNYDEVLLDAGDQFAEAMEKHRDG